jgi:hypothetical protein
MPGRILDLVINLFSIGVIVLMVLSIATSIVVALGAVSRQTATWTGGQTQFSGDAGKRSEDLQDPNPRMGFTTKQNRSGQSPISPREG